MNLMYALTNKFVNQMYSYGHFRLTHPQANKKTTRSTLNAPGQLIYLNKEFYDDRFFRKRQHFQQKS
jgi:hypothetical protein